MVFGCSKRRPQAWTPGSFPGGRSSIPSTLISNMPVFPLPGPPIVGAPAPAMAFSTTPMVFPMQMPASVQSVPITVQQPSPVFVQVTPTPSFAVLPQPPPHVPSPVVPPQLFQVISDDHHIDPHSASMQVTGPPQHQAQQQRRSPDNITLNLYVNSPRRHSRQLRERTPSPQPESQQPDLQHQQWMAQQLEQIQHLQQQQKQLQQQQMQLQHQQGQQQLLLARPQSAQNPTVVIESNIIRSAPLPPINIPHPPFHC